MSAKTLWGLVVVGALVCTMPGVSWAQSTEQRVTNLEVMVADLQARVEALEAGTGVVACLTTQPGLGVVDDVVFEGCNVHIRNSSGSTTGTPDGTGNLIVGYNEDETPELDRSGSHNLVIGRRNSYSSYGGLVMGNQNNITAPFASVVGGIRNTASGEGATVNGGRTNTASGLESSVSGGQLNTASGEFSSVVGGRENIASGRHATVAGGVLGTASGPGSVIGGGANNIASGVQTTVSGGNTNVASSNHSTVSGGRNRTTSGEFDWRGGEFFSED